MHNSLYRIPDEQDLQLDEVLTQIADHMARARQPFGEPVSIHYDIDPVGTTAKRAFPIALLLTEAVSSALDASCPDDGSATLSISLKHADGDAVVLTIESDWPPSKTIATGDDSLSEKLIKGFVTQLEGQSRLNTENGYCLHVTIPNPR